MRALLCATLLLGWVSSCLLIHDFDVEPELVSTGGTGGSAGGAGGGGSGAGGQPTGPCEPSAPVELASQPGTLIKHVDVDPGSTGRVFYTMERESSAGGTGGAGGAGGAGGGDPVSEIRSVNKDGTDDALLLSSSTDVYDFIKVSNTRVYFTNYGAGVHSVLKTGAEPISIFTMPGVMAGLTLGARSHEVVYYHDHDVDRQPRWGGPSQADDLLSSADTDRGYGMVVDPSDETQIYWTTWADGTPTGTVVYRPDFDTTHVLADGLVKPSGIALDEDYVYWIDAEGSLYRHERANLAAGSEMLVPGQSSESGVGGPVLVDDTHLYWGLVGGLFRVAKDGSGSPELLLTATRVSDLAMDDDAIYATTWEDEKLYKVPCN